MAITEQEIGRLARTARLFIAEDALAGHAASLNAMLELAGSLQVIDCSAAEPMVHPLQGAQYLREDTVTESDRREAFQAVAPVVEAGLYLVPRVVE